MELIFKNSVSKFIFLLYMPRSGSTLLASEIAGKTTAINVMPETKIVEQLMACDRLPNNYENQEYIKSLILSDMRWQNMAVDEDDLEKLLINRTKGLKSLVSELAELHNNRPADYCLVKNGNAIWTYKKLVEIFGKDIIFLYIERDPRGCLSSFLKNESAYKKSFRVKLSSLNICKIWKRYIKKIEEIENEGYKVIRVNYEDLVVNTDKVISKILLNELDVERNKIVDSTISQRKYPISDHEKSLHQNIGHDAIIERINAWKKELPAKDGCMAEMYLNNYINETYFVNKIPILKRQLYYIISYCYSIYVKYYNKIQILMFYIKNNDLTGLLIKLRMKLLPYGILK